MTIEGSVLDAPEADEVSAWETLESAHPYRVRANYQSHMAQVSADGELTNLTGLSAIEEWADEHRLSNVDKERLVQADLAAVTGVADTEANPNISKETETMSPTPPTPAAAGRAPAEQRIGNNMPKPDWQEVINRLQERAPGERGRVYLPKAGAEYSGKVLMVTDTHLVQQVGKATAIAHDLSKIDGGRELGPLSRAGMQATFAYGQERGTGRTMSFNEKRAEDVYKELATWAEKNITNAKGRETFMKHLSVATKDMALPAPTQRPPAPAVPVKAGPSPERGR